MVLANLQESARAHTENVLMERKTDAQRFNTSPSSRITTDQFSQMLKSVCSQRICLACKPH